MNVDELVRDHARLQSLKTVLQHTAIASLTCTEPRTIGPDQPKTKRLEQPEKKVVRKTVPAVSSSPPDAVNKNCEIFSTDDLIHTIGPDQPKTIRLEMQPAKKVVPKTVLAVSSSPPDAVNKKCEIFSTDDLIHTSILSDADVINACILKRELDDEYKRNVRMQLKEINERQQNAIKERQRLQPATEQQQGRVNRRALREETDKLAEQMANLEMEKQQREQLALIRQNNLKLHLLTIEGVSRCHSRFCSKYEEVATLLLALDKETVQACAGSNYELRELGQQFDQLVDKIKSENFEQTASSCVFTAENFCQKLNKLEKNLHKHLSEQAQQQLIKAKELAEEKEKQRQLEAEQQQQQQLLQQHKEQQEKEQKRLEQEAQAKENAAAAEASTKAAAASTTAATVNISTSYVHPTRLAFYNEIIALYQQKVDAVKPLQTDETWKKYRTNCQRTINVPLNAITAASPQHLTTNFDKLYNFFAGQPVRTMDGSTITINDHPLARDYCILLMAKKFVSQTDTAISSNPQAAFPFASVINSFWKLLPDFGKTFLAYMYKESPYLVPYVIPQQPDQTPVQYLKTMGYRLSENNELEKPDMFLKRQTGIARLYAAVIITPGRKGDGPTKCYGLEEAWIWLTHIMLVKPLPDICATMIMEMLQTLGFDLWRAYGQNFLKLLVYIQTIYMPQLSAYDEGGPKTRLEMLLSKFLRERQIPQAVGVLPPGFW